MKVKMKILDRQTHIHWHEVSVRKETCMEPFPSIRQEMMHHVDQSTHIQW